MASLETDPKKKVLGRGLASLIPGVGAGEEAGARPAQKNFFECDIEKIVPNTYQPRKIFDKDALEELVESIKVHGIIQPLVVRQRDGHYELIAGERRWRAAQRAGLKKVPVVVKELEGDVPSLELAIVENIQREQLNCIEEAIAYQQLMDEFQLSQEDIAHRVGKNRATIANTMRLLKLPAIIREDLTSGQLTMGHARALLSLESAEDQLRLREMVIKKKMSVRETERQVNDLMKRGASAEPTTEEGNKDFDPNLKALEDDLRRKFGVQVKFFGNGTRGMIQFPYSSPEELMALADKLKEEHVSTPIGPI
jgi:ParB family transcriptional regulator, chromosome partitioning protein